MLSDRIRRQVDRLLDQAEEAIALRQWEELRATCETLLSLDPDNSDAKLYLALADKSLDTDVVSGSSDIVEPPEDPAPAANTPPPPVVPQDAEPEDRPDTNPIDSRTAGQRVRDLAVANSKLALEQPAIGEPDSPLEAAPRSARTRSQRRFNTEVGEGLTQSSEAILRNPNITEAKTNISLLSWLFGFGGRLDKDGYRLRWVFGFGVGGILLGISFVNTLLPYSIALNTFMSVVWFGGWSFILVNGASSHVRRLHDFNKSGWWLLFWFIPIAGFVLSVVLWGGKGNGLIPNKYGGLRLWRSGLPY